MLNSSGGFSTPTAPLSSSSSDRTASFSPSPVIGSSQRPSSNSVFLIDDELFSLSSRSEHRPNSFSEELFSPSDGHSSTPPTSKRLMSNSSSPSLLLQQHSPTAPHSAPLYMSVHTSTPSIPLAKTSVSSSSHIPKATDDQDSLSNDRLSSSAEKKLEASMDTIKHLITSSMQVPPSIGLDQEDESSTISSIFWIDASVFEQGKTMRSFYELFFFLAIPLFFFFLQ